jgi:hypothetical protein
LFFTEQCPSGYRLGCEVFKVFSRFQDFGHRQHNDLRAFLRLAGRRFQSSNLLGERCNLLLVRLQGFGAFRVTFRLFFGFGFLAFRLDPVSFGFCLGFRFSLFSGLPFELQPVQAFFFGSEFERQAREKAEAEAKAKAEADRIEAERQKAEAEEQAKRDAERAEALKPDKEKIAAFAKKIRALKPPTCQTEEGSKIIVLAMAKILETAEYLEDFATEPVPAGALFGEEQPTGPYGDKR